MGNQTSVDPVHQRMYSNMIQIHDPSKRIQIIQTCLASMEYVNSSKRAGIYSYLLHYVSTVQSGGNPPVLPGEQQAFTPSAVPRTLQPNMAQGIGALGTQYGNLGTQQAALGQTAQGLGQSDVNQLYNLGSVQQKQSQAVLDAQRATAMQNAMQPYQQLAFQSDIYKGAPSSQMGITTQMQPTPSPFQQIAGLGTGLVTGAAAASKLGLF